MSISYPAKDFLDEFAIWRQMRASGQMRSRMNSFETAKVLFSMRYPERACFSYRFNRFVCILQAIHGELPALIQDRIAVPDGGRSGGAFVPDDLLLALHEWYCLQSEEEMRRMPDPDWDAVLAIYDRLSESGEEN